MAVGFPVMTKARARRLVAIGNLISGVYAMLGLLGMLLTQMQSDEVLAVIPVTPASSVVYLVIGLVGVAMSVEPARAQLYLAGTGGLLVLWGLLCLAVGGSDVFPRDAALVALLLSSGALALATALAPPLARLDRALG
jgi:Domain of unknown function (DUF4383)